MENMGDIYETNVFNKTAEMLTENQKTSTVGNIKAGDGFEGAEDKGKPKTDPYEHAGKPAKPTEGPSNDPKAGKPTKLAKKSVAGMNDSAENKDDMRLSFDDLYRKTITEADEDIVPAADPESADFDEDTGDFGATDTVGGEETDIDEEVDLASELRMLADRLNEIADKLSVDEGVGSDELGGEPEIDDGGEDLSMGGEGAAFGAGASAAGGEAARVGESVQRIAEAIKSEPTPKMARKTTLNPKMSLNPKASGYTKKSGAGKAKVPSAGKDRTGTPSVLGATKFGPKMSQNPQGSGPAVKGAQAPLIA